MFTVLVAFIFLFFLPKNTGHTRPLIGLPSFDLFTDRDREILSRRIALEDRGRSMGLSAIKPRQVFKQLTTNYLMWFHAIIAIVSLTPKGGLLLYAPTLIKNLGFDKIRANLLASVSNFALIVLNLFAAWVSDKTRLRGPICIICTSYALVLAGVQYSLVLSTDKWAKYAVFVLFMAGNATFQGINSAWMAANLRDPNALGVAQALIVMAANLGGLAGQQLFRDEDAPRYTSGFLGIMCLYAGALLLILGLTFVYIRKNRKVLTVASSREDGAVGSEATTEETKYQI